MQRGLVGSEMCIRDSNVNFMEQKTNVMLRCDRTVLLDAHKDLKSYIMPQGYAAGTRRLHDVEKQSLIGHDVGDVVRTLN